MSAGLPDTSATPEQAVAVAVRTQQTVQRLFTRFPEMTLAVPPEQLKPSLGFVFYAHQALPVQLTH